MPIRDFRLDDATGGESDEEEYPPSDDAEEDHDSSADEFIGTVTSPRKTRRNAKDAVPVDQTASQGIIVQTAFDAYFTQMSTRSQTSSNVFSSIVEPLTAEEYTEGMRLASLPGASLSALKPRLLSPTELPKLFGRFMVELEEGFNIITYGYGSKRRVLNQFATEYCAKKGHVVVANGFHPDFTLKDLLNSTESTVPDILSPGTSGGNTVEAQAKRIREYFSTKDHTPRAKRQGSRHLYLIIHNIDSAQLRNSRAKACLSLLALTPNIHVVSSVDHINSPLIWSSSESSARKPDIGAEPHPSSSNNEDDTSRPTASSTRSGFAWVWHDLTTLEPYDHELAFVDRSSLSSAHGGGLRKRIDTSQVTQGGANMTETAALHILASVTAKAQKLFSLVGNRQLEAIEEEAATAENAGGESGDKPGDLQRFAIAYDALFILARDNFVATNDTSLRSLLGEFRDHGLVVSAQSASGTGEILWIPLRKERLGNVLRTLQTDA